MPNHVHFIMVPGHGDGLRATFGEAHRRYTGRINARLRQTGHLWQGRFSSVVMDEGHLIAAARYVALNPVKAGLCADAADWPWSSARAHLAGRDDGLVTVAPLRSRIPDFDRFLAADDDPAADRALERAAAVGRPLGAPEWIADLERRTGLALAPRNPGPRPRPSAETNDVYLFSKLSP
jgi:putative transposase